jgi:hypothetical protein
MMARVRDAFQRRPELRNVEEIRSALGVESQHRRKRNEVERFRPLAEGRSPTGLCMRSMRARSLTIDQVVVEDVYSQAEKRLRPAPVLYFRETKKGLVLSGTNQDALQALFGDDVTTCCGSGLRQAGAP